MPELTIVIPVFDRDEELRRALRSISAKRREVRVEGDAEVRGEGDAEVRVESQGETRVERATEMRVEGEAEVRVEGEGDAQADGDGANGGPSTATAVIAGAAEVIIVDDGSSAPFAGVVAQLAAERSANGRRSIRIANRGPSGARNAGLQVALGRYVMFLDSDDELAEGALVMVHALLTDGEVGMLCCAVRVVAADGTVRTVRPDARPGVPSAELSELSGSFVVRTDIAAAIGGYDEVLRFGENTDFILRLADECRRGGQRMVSTDAVLSVYHEPSGRRRYDAERYEAAVHLLHRGRFDLAIPAQRASVQAIAAVNAARIGRYSQSVKYAAKAVGTEPRNLRHLVRLALACTGPFAKRRWLEP